MRKDANAHRISLLSKHPIAAMLPANFHPANSSRCGIKRIVQLLALAGSLVLMLQGLVNAAELKTISTASVKSAAAKAATIKTAVVSTIPAQPEAVKTATTKPTTANTTNKTVKTATTQTQPAPCAPLIDAWLISTRHLGCTNGAFPANGPALRYWQRVDNQGPWQPRQFSDFLAASQEVRTTWIMVHGNRMNSQDAVNYGSQVTQSLLPGHKSGLPLRTITWSWPSDQMRGLFEDVRTKANRTPSESFYLGWLVNQMPLETPVAFIGHSFGRGSAPARCTCSPAAR